MISREALLEESICNSDNHEKVLHNYEQRQRLSRFLATPEGDKAIVVGSAAHSAFTEEARLFFDVDMLLEGRDCRDAARGFWPKEIVGWLDLCNVDATVFPEVEEAILPKRLSIDDPINIRTPSVEWHLATVLCRLYESASRDLIIHKKYYDVWALAQSDNIDTRKVQKAIKHLLRSKEEYFREDRGKVLEGIKKFNKKGFCSWSWDSGKKERPANSTATPQKVLDTVNQVTAEFRF
ncbi:MAG: nucleotidyl transferase AbiEii/AbiGii toxin family protein [Firmicutes bacterium]|nr:nucleotidyl transferase AbiEii/AbiGii toxin family protein [Bacillota bacterium]